METERILKFTISRHAMIQMQRRGLTREVVRQVLAEPGQRHEIRPGRVVVQARITLGMPETGYLVRVFVDVDREPPAVVTVYRTSKIDKYWR